LPTPGDARLDQAIVAQIFLKIRELYKKDGGKFPIRSEPDLELQRPIEPAPGRGIEGSKRKALADLEDPATKQQIKPASSFPASLG